MGRWGILAMLAMLTTPILGLWMGVAGRGRARPPTCPPSTKNRPENARILIVGRVVWWGCWAMRAMREKKPQAMRAMGGRVGAPPPQTAPLSPYTRPVHAHPSGGRWWGLGVGIGAQYHDFFSACRPNFFFFRATRAPDHIRSADIFVIFFLTALTGFNAANGP